MFIHIAIIILTVVVSISAFSKRELLYKYQFNAYQVMQRKEWWRVFSYGLLHGDYTHLFINMFILWSFGNSLMYYFEHYLPYNSTFLFLFFYISALALSTLYALNKHKDNFYYNAVGASGAISAVVFTCIFFNPWHKLYLFAIIPIPGIVFGLGYLYYSYTMNKKGQDNIGHNAHFWGAVYGFLFPIILKPDLITVFIKQLINIQF